MILHSRMCLVWAVALLLAGAAGRAAADEPAPGAMPFGDFSWMHGANYTPSYAATDVEFWLKYDHQVIDRELGYAQRIGLNCVRVFLQSLVWEHKPEQFAAHFSDFVTTADRHGLKVMPILFDSCFGVAPSLESCHVWVANPGPDRMGSEHFPALDAYVRAVVTPLVGDRRIALWDVMNEPTVTVLSATEKGKAQIRAFVEHYCRLVHKLDPTHAITVGVASSDSRPVLGLVDVLSCHSYTAQRDTFRANLAAAQAQARAAGKPWIVSECCAPGWGNQYEMVLPVLRQFQVGHTVWELMIGRDMFAPVSGLFYPDGTVRRLSAIEAVMNARPPEGLTEKPDAVGVPIGPRRGELLARYVQFTARNAVTDQTWRERNTLVHALAVRNVYRGDGPDVLRRLAEARAAYRQGDKPTAYRTVEALLKQAAERLTPKKATKPKADTGASERPDARRLKLAGADAGRLSGGDGL